MALLRRPAKLTLNLHNTSRTMSTTKISQCNLNVKSKGQSLQSKNNGMSDRQRIIKLFGLQNKLTELENVKYEDLRKNKDEGHQWKGILKLKWPIPIELEKIGRSKQFVTNDLFREVVEILEKKGFFDEKRSIDFKKWKEIDRNSSILKFTDETRIKLDELLKSFQELKQSLNDIVEEERKKFDSISSNEILSESIETESISDEMLNETEPKCDPSTSVNNFLDVITGYPLNRLKLIDEDLELRNFSLQFHWIKLKNDRNPRIQKIFDDRQSLPIYYIKQEFLDALDANRVVLLRGDTGCGKTTQIPQIIFENFVEKMNGASCNIVVTQPRRISAISVSERISKERNERIGTTVGYRVRLKQKSPNGNGSILFTTPGMLLRNRFDNPNFEGVSHVIVDEVHERDIWTDFLLISLKRAMKINKNLKLILMSATFGIEKFQKYFSNCPVIETFGRKFDVEEYFLEDVYKLLNKVSSTMVVEDSNDANVRLPTDVDTLVDTVIHVHNAQPPGAILCFLPTTADIKAVHKNIFDRAPFCDMLVLQCHSKLPIEEQEKVFLRPPDGVRKVILATNIAETSITIDDVRYVINSGTQKSQVFDRDSESMRVVETFASRAAQIQRKGRAGRVADGRCYHLFTKKRWEMLEENFVPQLLRAQLSNVVLLAKVCSHDEDPAEFLADAIDPPNHYQIENAIEELTEMKFLNSKRNFTPMGKRLCQFGCSPMLSKSMLYGVVLKCIDPVLSIASMCDSKQSFFTQKFHEMGKIERLEIVKNLIGSTFSDYILFANLFKSYLDEWKINSDEIYFNKMSFQHVEDLRKLFAGQIVSGGLCQSEDECLNLDKDLNSFAKNENLIKVNNFSITPLLYPSYCGHIPLCITDLNCFNKCAMAAGSHQNLLKLRLPDGEITSRNKFHFVDNFRRPVFNLGQSSIEDILKKDQKPSSQWFNCIQKVLDVEGRSFKVDGLSMLNPVAALLFSGFNLSNYQKDSTIVSLQPSVNFKFKFENEKDKDVIFALRDVLDEFVEWYCLRISEKINTSEKENFKKFHADLLDTTVILLEDTNINKT